jgi:SAM-dependent methyltransferase
LFSTSRRGAGRSAQVGPTYRDPVAFQDWMDHDRWLERRSSFGPAAQLYDEIRPTYPEPAVAWALRPLGLDVARVADIGAGTGIMTRVLLGLGNPTVAVEPDPQMLARLVATTPAAGAVVGRAEALPLAAGCVDGAVAAQAYHWFDRDRAHAELARVIRAGGVLAAIWNERDERESWVRRYSELIERDQGPGDHQGHRPDFGGLFSPVEFRQFAHAVMHTPESLLTLVRSRSYYITASAERQVELLAEVRELIRTHHDLAGRTEFPLPYVTQVFRAQRR